MRLTLKPVSIRLATAADVESVTALVTALAEKFILFEFSEQGRARFLADHTVAKMRERMNGGFRYHLAEIDGELVGMVGTRDNSHLHHLFVAEGFQCRGVGRRLWEHAAAECRKAGDPRVFTVNSSRNAVAVYEKFGFCVSGSLQNAGGVLFVPMKLILDAGHLS